MASAVHRLGAHALLRSFAAGRVSVVQTTRHFLDRIDRCNPALNAFVHLDRAGALASAERSSAAYDAGTPRPLEGLPVAVKANIAVRGMPHHAGIGALSGNIASADAQAVASLRAAGAVILGLCNMDEAALGAITDNPHFGATRNPWQPDRSPGGSSGGSAVAVAAGLCAAALGTDTLGSIRIPAGWCGIAGLKPTTGLVPTEGLIPLSPALDCIGPMTRHIDDCGLLLGVLASPLPARTLPRIAVPEWAHSTDLDPAVAAAFRLAASLLKGLGHTIEPRRLEADHAGLRLAAFTQAVDGLRDLLGGPLSFRQADLSPRLQGWLEIAATISPAVRAQGARLIDDAGSGVRSMLRVADAILLPTTPTAPPAAGEEPPDTLGDFTCLASLAGLPAAAIAAGWTADGLPVGVQLIGRAGEDLALIKLAAALELAINAVGLPPAFA